jgi:phage tail-like protein
MSIVRDQPYPGMNFLVDIGTGETSGPGAGLVEVVFPEARLQMMDYRAGNDRENTKRKLQTITQYGNLILRRCVYGALDWYQWWDASRDGDQNDMRTITINLLNEDHTETVLTWRFLRARPVNHQFSSLNAIGTVQLIESLELAFERVEME